MTSPRLPPPLDYYNRPPKELAGYQNSTVDDGDETPAPTRSIVAGEAISLLAGFGPVTLYQQGAALDPYTLAFKRTKYNAAAYNYVRLTVDVLEAGASSSRMQVFYSLTGAPGTFVSAGLTGPAQVSIGTVGIQVGGGFFVAAAGADVYWAVQAYGGDGSASPRLDLVTLQFELQQNVTLPPETLYVRHAAPSAHSCLAKYDGGWIDRFGVNSLETLGVVREDLQYANVLQQFVLTSDPASAGWTPGVGGSGLGGWTGITDDESNGAIARAGIILLNCFNASQGFSRSFTLPAATDPCGVGAEVRMKFRKQGGTWTVVGFPGQCSGTWGPTQCGPSDLCACPVWAMITISGSFGTRCMSARVAEYGMGWDGSAPWATMRFRLPAGASGSVTIGFELGSDCSGASCYGVGYGSWTAALSAIVITDPAPPMLIFSSTKGSSARIAKPETDYDSKRASGGFARVYGAPLAAQTVPAWTYQLRIAAAMAASTRYAEGHVTGRLWVWRSTGDVDVGTIGTFVSAAIAGTSLVEQDISFAGASIDVQAGDQLVLDLAGSADAPAGQKLESSAPWFQFDGTDDAFSTGSAPAVGGAATHLTVPGLQYTGAAP